MFSRMALRLSSAIAVLAFAIALGMTGLKPFASAAKGHSIEAAYMDCTCGAGDTCGCVPSFE